MEAVLLISINPSSVLEKSLTNICIAADGLCNVQVLLVAPATVAYATFQIAAQAVFDQCAADSRSAKGGRKQYECTIFKNLQDTYGLLEMVTTTWRLCSSPQLIHSLHTMILLAPHSCPLSPSRIMNIFRAAV